MINADDEDQGYQEGSLFHDVPYRDAPDLDTAALLTALRKSQDAGAARLLEALRGQVDAVVEKLLPVLTERIEEIRQEMLASLERWRGLLYAELAGALEILEQDRADLKARVSRLETALAEVEGRQAGKKSGG